MNRRIYLTLVNGVIKTLKAITSSSGSSDADSIVATGSDGRLDESLMPAGMGSRTKFIEATETLSAGELVNVHDDSGEKVRKADASNGRPAHGFVKESVDSGNDAKVFFFGEITGVSGLTPGAFVYLSDSTAGDITETAPDSEGSMVQNVGEAVATDTAWFRRGDPIEIEEA